MELTPGWCRLRLCIFFSLSITDSSSSIMDMLSVQAVLVAQSTVLLDGLDGIIRSMVRGPDVTTSDLNLKMHTFPLQA